MRQVYCDNSSTSFPKAPGLGKVIGEHIDTNGYNVSRGGYSQAYSLEAGIMQTREQIAGMFGAADPESVIFTPGATIGLNMLLKGFLRKGDHVITTSMEHNAVARPLRQLEEQGVKWTRAYCDRQGVIDLSDLEDQITEDTRLICVVHGSNVNGTMMPVEEIGRICAEHGIMFAVDASQTAGSCHLDIQSCHADAVVFPGHKGLMGPQGIGALVLSQQIADRMYPYFSGGTGSFSEHEEMPDFLPDKFQPGTLNIPGIIGLGHSLSFLEQVGIDAVAAKKDMLTGAFIERVKNMDNVILTGIAGTEGRCSAVSIDNTVTDNAELAFMLESEYGIMTRCGLHCAPMAHRTMGTFPHGTLRFSFGYFNTMEEIEYVTDAIYKCLK